MCGINIKYGEFIPKMSGKLFVVTDSDIIDLHLSTNSDGCRFNDSSVQRAVFCELLGTLINTLHK